MTDQGQAGRDGRAAAQRWLLARCHHHRLSPTQRRVAHSFVQTMPDAAFLSTSQAAARAGVSQATVTRFAATLGFTTYADFRGALRTVILGGGAAATADAAHGVGMDPVEEARETLAVVATTVSSPAMGAAVAALAQATTLGVVGMRASAALAEYAGFFARRIVDDVRVVTDADAVPDTLAQMGLTGAASGSSAVLVIAMPRHPASTVRALRMARALGLTTVLVVDTPFVDFVGDADHVLVAPVGVDLVFDTHAAPLVVLSALLDGIANAHPRRTQDRLEAHELLVDSWVHHEDDAEEDHEDEDDAG